VQGRSARDVGERHEVGRIARGTHARKAKTGSERQYSMKTCASDHGYPATENMRGALCVVLLAGCGRFGFERAPLDGWSDAASDGDATVDAASVCLTENFSAAPLDPLRWTTYENAPASLSTTSGELVLQLGTVSTPAYAGILSRTGDHTGTTLDLEITEAPIKFPGAEAALKLRTASNDFYLLHVTNGRLAWDQQLLGASVDTGSVAFDLVLQRHWRMQHDASLNLVRFLTSPDGVSWTLLRETMVVVPVTNVLVEVTAGTYASIASPGRARFDNLVITGCSS
jgi:hypothetical protein